MADVINQNVNLVTITQNLIVKFIVTVKLLGVLSVSIPLFISFFSAVLHTALLGNNHRELFIVSTELKRISLFQNLPQEVKWGVDEKKEWPGVINL